MNWKRKLAESLIDRVVLVVLAAILLGAVEYRFADLQRARDARAAVSTVMTDALMQQRESLMEAVDDYMLLIDGLVETSSPPDATLSRAERKIRLASGFFAAVSSADVIKSNASDLESAMARLSSFVRGDRQGSGTASPFETLQGLQDEFMKSYVQFTSDIRTVTLEAVDLETAS